MKTMHRHIVWLAALILDFLVLAFPAAAQLFEVMEKLMTPGS